MTPTITLRHLYPDLMNIYGDQGNIIALVARAKWRGYDVKVTRHAVGDRLTANQTDIYFMGGGQDRSQLLVAEDLQAHADTIRGDIENGVCALLICGGYQLFGQSYVDTDDNILPGIGIFDVVTRAGKRRMIGNILIETVGVIPEQPLIGFENHGGRTALGPKAQPFGRVIEGHGNNGDDNTEGIVYKNAIGTYMHGSLLPKNPILTDHILQSAFRRKYPDLTLQPLDNTIETAAFDEARERLR